MTSSVATANDQKVRHRRFGCPSLNLLSTISRHPKYLTVALNFNHHPMANGHWPMPISISYFSLYLSSVSIIISFKSPKCYCLFPFAWKNTVSALTSLKTVEATSPLLTRQKTIIIIVITIDFYLTKLWEVEYWIFVADICSDSSDWDQDLCTC